MNMIIRLKERLSAETFALVAVFYIAIIVFITLFFAFEPIKLYGDTTLNIGLLWLYISIAYITFSFRWYTDSDGNSGYIDAGQIAVLKRWGNPIEVLKPGLPFVPLVVFTIEKLSTIVQQKEFPAEPQNIYRGDMKDKIGLTGDMKPPTRVTFRNSVGDSVAKKLLGSDYEFYTEIIEKGDEGMANITKNEPVKFISEAPKDGLAKRVTAEIVAVVRWKIVKGVDFLQNIGSPDKVNQQIEDELFSVLQRVLPTMSVGQAMQNYKWINALLVKYARNRTIGWGIEIEGAFLKMIPLNHSLNDAIALEAEAGFKGLGERRIIEETGAGHAKAAEDLERQTLTGRAEGLQKLATSLGIEGKEAIAQFVAGQMAQGEGTIILGAEGLGQLAGVGAALLNKNATNNNITTQE